MSFGNAINGAWMTFECPQCGLDNSCQIRQVELGERVHCRGCHESIQLVDQDASTVLTKRLMNNAMDDLQKVLNRLR